MNLPKLKWWHIGALVGLGIGLANLYFVVVVAASRAYFAGAGIFGILLELPVLPIFILVGFFLEGLSLYFGSTIVLILIHLISWILGGIFYAWIFRLITKHSRKNKKQLGFALPVAILIVVVLIVAGGAGYYFYKTSVDETAGWETYTNEKYGYSFKYPPECKYGVWTPEVLPTECFCFLNVKDPDDVLLELRYVSEKDKLVSAAFSVRHCSDSWDKESDSPCSPADFLIHNPPPGTELVSWLKENYKEGLNGDIPDKPNFEIDGIPAVNVLNEFPLDPPNERIFFIKNYRLFDITLWYVDSESNKELYNQILSTFKFIEIDETADWEVYQNEEYGFELKYPKDWKMVNVDWTVGRKRKYARFSSPLIDNKYYLALNFGARNKGDNILISYQPDEDWELLKSFMRLGDKVKIGNVDVLTTEIVEKGKVHSILYSNRLGADRVEISGLEIQADLGIVEGPQHLSASDVESIDLKNLPELKLANQILSTFKFIGK